MKFSDFYNEYYPRLLRFAAGFIPFEEAENIVQDVFLDLWEKREAFGFIKNINAYCYKLVKNKCLDYIKHRLSVEKFARNTQSAFEAELALQQTSIDEFDVSEIAEKEVRHELSVAIKSLPQRCRQIFLLSRIDGLKYREISDKLGLSVNTVETQMGIALKRLKVQLRERLSA